MIFTRFNLTVKLHLFLAEYDLSGTNFFNLHIVGLVQLMHFNFSQPPLVAKAASPPHIQVQLSHSPAAQDSNLSSTLTALHILPILSAERVKMIKSDTWFLKS